MSIWTRILTQALFSGSSSMTVAQAVHRLAHQQVTKSIIGAFYQTYGELGYGFLESVYETALAIVLEDEGLKIQRQAPITVRFRGREIGQYRADLLVEECVVVELKAVRRLEPAHEAQLLNSLKATSIEVGLLLNFGPRPQFKRMVFANVRKNREAQVNTTTAKAADERG